MQISQTTQEIRQETDMMLGVLDDLSALGAIDTSYWLYASRTVMALANAKRTCIALNQAGRQ